MDTLTIQKDAFEKIQSISTSTSQTYRILQFCEHYLKKLTYSDDSVNGYINIPSRTLRNFGHDRYRDMIIDPLVEAGLLQETSYSNGRFSKAYRIGMLLEPLKEEVHVKMIHKLNRLKKGQGVELLNPADVKSTFNEIKKGKQYADETTEYTKKLLKALDIDYVSAKKHILSPPLENGFEVRQRRVADFHNKNFFCSRSKTNDRLNSSIAFLPSELIQFVTYRGQNLIELDLSCSQPTMIADKGLRKGDFTKSDNFVQDVEKGIFYDRIVDEYNNRHSNKVTRDFIKGQLFGVVYGNGIGRIHIRKTVNTLLDVYPELIGFVEFEKGQLQSKNLFPIELQKKEASIFVDKIYRRMIDQNIFGFSKHDGILTIEENKEKVLEIMNEELCGELKLQFSISTKL